jgi:SAM-dependent methyltransferase
VSTIDSASVRLADAVVWCDVENGAYAGDLALWEELAAGASGPVLELGCGTGRVALHLARRGHHVVAVDRDPSLVAAVGDRASEEGLDVEPAVADARDLRLGRRFACVLAPMQLAHLLDGPAAREAMVSGLAAHLSDGGVAAIALLDPASARAGSFEDGAGELLPDVREVDGWAYTSQPIAVRSIDTGLEVHRRRQVVSPDGELGEGSEVIHMAWVEPEEIEAQARQAGLQPLPRRAIAPTADHVGSVVVLLSAS